MKTGKPWGSTALQTFVAKTVITITRKYNKTQEKDSGLKTYL